VEEKVESQQDRPVLGSPDRGIPEFRSKEGPADSPIVKDSNKLAILLLGREDGWHKRSQK